MIGILILDTDFPRLHGDIGNPSSFNTAVKYARITGASVEAIVSDGAIEGAMIDRFVDAAQDLERAGATVIGTSCGFLGAVQPDIQASLRVPFIASSLLLLPLLRTVFGEASTVSVLTFDASRLGPQHFGGHIDPQVRISGLDPQSHWYQCIANNRTKIDQTRARQDVLELVERAIQPQPSLLLIECTNLSPWKAEIRERTGLPVFDLVDALEWLHRSVG